MLKEDGGILASCLLQLLPGLVSSLIQDTAALICSQTGLLHYEYGT